MDRQMDRWIDRQMNRWRDGQKERWMNRWMDGWMNGQIDGQMDKQMDGQMRFPRYTSSFFYFCEIKASKKANFDLNLTGKNGQL